MAVAITDGATTIISDFPYQSGYSGYMTYDPGEIKSQTSQTLALVTHRHADHWEAQLFAKTNWKVIGPADVTKGLPADRIVPVADRVTFGAAQIEPIETPHARIGHYSYLVTWNGRRLYFSGDTESTDRLLATKNIDVAFLSPWLYQAALKRGGLAARRVVIYHHQAGQRVPECRQGCTVPQQGETLTF
jgi:L-ascorbate metabolism protein UlaG (beta-lactamase superfamily)